MVLLSPKMLGVAAGRRALLTSRGYSSGRVVETGQNGLYAAVIGGALCLFGGIGYLLVKELAMPGGGYPIISQTVERLEQDARVAEMLGGSKLAVHGVGDGHGRRRPVFKQSLMEDGRQTIDAVFYVQGARNRAKVTLQAVETADGSWDERYLALSLPGQPTHVLIQPQVRQALPSGWHPLKKWFR